MNSSETSTKRPPKADGSLERSASRPWDRLGAMAATLRPHPDDWRQAARVMIGSAAAFALYEVLRLPQGYWAVFTVVIVMQGSVGGTLGASGDRMLGTTAGALIGGIAAAAHPATRIELGAALVTSIGLATLLAAVRPRLKVAPVTAAIMLLRGCEFSLASRREH